MENLSHTLVGGLMAKAGLERVTSLAMPTLLIAANLPDVDAISLVWGRENYLQYHRGITHTFLGITVLAFLLALAMWSYDRRVRLKKAPERVPASFWGLVIISFLGLLSHLLMDYTNSYGVRPFLPFSHIWYYGDLAVIVDPWIWVIVGGGFLLSWRSRKHAAPIAVTALATLVLYWCGLAYCHQRAVNQIAMLARQENPKVSIVSEAAFPQFANPFKWRLLAETPTQLWIWTEDLRKPAPKHPLRFERLTQPSIIQAIAATPTGKNFLGFARYVSATIKQDHGKTDVVLRDSRLNLRAYFVLDAGSHVEAAHMIPWR